MRDGANPSTTVASHRRGEPRIHGVSVKPSGLFDSVLHNPGGYRTEGMWIGPSDSLMIWFSMECLANLPALREHERPCKPDEYTCFPQTQLCSTQTGAPTRRLTEMRGPETDREDHLTMLKLTVSTKAFDLNQVPKSMFMSLVNKWFQICLSVPLTIVECLLVNSALFYSSYSRLNQIADIPLTIAESAYLRKINCHSNTCYWNKCAISAKKTVIINSHTAPPQFFM